jgi:hypothetical protein
MNMTDLQHEEAETDRIADAPPKRDDPDWQSLDRLDLIFWGMVFGAGGVFLLFFFRVI